MAAEKLSLCPEISWRNSHKGSPCKAKIDFLCVLDTKYLVGRKEGMKHLHLIDLDLVASAFHLSHTI